MQARYLLPLLMAVGVLPAHAAPAADPFRVPADLKKAALARKADLAALKIGVGPFMHLHSAKLADFGQTAKTPVGEPEFYDFNKTYPDAMKGGISGGAYHLNLTKAGYSRSIYLPNDHSDFEVNVKTKWLSGSEKSGYGLLMNVSGDDYYACQVTQNGGAKLVKRYKGNSTDLQGWLDISGSLQPGENVLGAAVHGSLVSCFVNGNRVLHHLVLGPLPKGRVGFVVTEAMHLTIDDFEIIEMQDNPDEHVFGSGYDYAEEVLRGLVRSDLFAGGQVGISNDPSAEGWDFVLGADSIGFAKKGGVSYYILPRGSEASDAKEELPLPEEWDKPSSSMGPSARSKAMEAFGEYLAFQVARRALKL